MLNRFIGFCSSSPGTLEIAELSASATPMAVERGNAAIFEVSSINHTVRESRPEKTGDMEERE